VVPIVEELVVARRVEIDDFGLYVMSEPLATWSVGNRNQEPAIPLLRSQRDRKAPGHESGTGTYGGSDHWSGNHAHDAAIVAPPSTTTTFTPAGWTAYHSLNRANHAAIRASSGGLCE